MNFLNVDNRRIPYTLRRSKRAKRLQIRVQRTGVEVIAPERLPLKHVEPFLHEKRQWVAETFARVAAPAINRSNSHFTSGSTVPYLGELWPLDITEDSKVGRRGEVVFSDLFQVSIPNGLQEDKKRLLVKRSLEDWLIDRLWYQIDRRLDGYAQLTGLPAQIRIKNQKRLWGSCSGRGNIALNWHLAFVPTSVIDYVLLHELCHLLQPDHSASYWSLVASIMPDYDTHRQWLRSCDWLRTLIWACDKPSIRRYQSG